MIDVEGREQKSSKTTGDRLIDAAAALMDIGGESAVTLRAVAQAVGVSHNAPYRHFTDRAALLGAVAERDFGVLTVAMLKIGRSKRMPIAKVKEASNALIAYGENYPARYRLLFSDADIATRGGDLEKAAMATFAAFAEIIASAQASADLPAMSASRLTGLIYATVHGLIDLQAGGRLRAEKGLSKASDGVTCLLKIIAPRHS